MEMTLSLGDIAAIATTVAGIAFGLLAAVWKIASWVRDDVKTLRAEAVTAHANIATNIKETRAELHSEIRTTRTEVREDVRDVREDLRTWISKAPPPPER